MTLLLHRECGNICLKCWRISNIDITFINNLYISIYKLEEIGLAIFPIIGYNDNCFRDVAQVVERYFREVEVASSSLVIPIIEKP